MELSLRKHKIVEDIAIYLVFLDHFMLSLFLLGVGTHVESSDDLIPAACVYRGR